jgi:hypothetical protein
MNDSRSFALHLTPLEVEWILHQLDAPALRFPLYESPARSLEDAVEGLRDAEAPLEKRGWVERREGDQLTLDVTVAGVVGVLGFSRRAIFVTQFREQDPRPELLRFFTAEDLLVGQRPREAGDEITLTALRDLETLRRRLIQYLDLREQRAPAEHAFRCEEDAFAAVPYILAGDGKPAAVAHLVEAGAEESLARDLAQAMACPLRQTTLEALELDPDHPDGIRPRDKLTLLEGTYGLWALNTCLDEDPVTIDILPCNAHRAQGLVSGLLEFLTP